MSIAILTVLIALSTTHPIQTSDGQNSGPRWAEAPYLQFPLQALDRVEEGNVTLTCVVAVDGRAKRCDVADEVPKDLGFGSAALEAVPGFRFVPAVQNGETVEQTARFNLSFRMQSSESPPGRRATPQEQEALGIIDRLGFNSGQCFEFLSERNRTEFETGLDGLSGESLQPVVDQVLFGAYGRGKADSVGKNLGLAFCESALESAQISFDENADIIEEFESTLPETARRSKPR